MSGEWSIVLGGQENHSFGEKSVILGGEYNENYGVLSLIRGGFGYELEASYSVAP